eukprot:TRINITY_DN11224_c0_g4_i1.p1 TRINITY_DN11224_c0_g4~~TRINITY_DN11224_c0_g4_i1.p1  ORF type:complete len:294 (-),score=60.76 TRINITY_DN11224_c0_g4_i1:610-1491(-)
MEAQHKNDNTSIRRKNMKWTTMQDELLIRLMVEQRKEGRGVKGGFTCEGWTLMTRSMRSQFGDTFTKDKLKNRFKTLKRTYRIMKGLLDQSGFRWDNKRKMVTAERSIWNEYVAAHPEAEIYKNKSFPDWVSLAIIFGDSVADGREDFASNDPEPIDAQAVANIPIMQADDVVNAYEEGIDDQDTSVSNTRSLRQNVSASTSHHVVRNRSNMEQALIGAVEAIASAISEYANKRARECPSMEKCIATLGEIGLSTAVYFKALDVLENERKAEIFLALPPSDRRGWISHQLGME